MPNESQESQITILEFHPPEDLRRFACRPGSIIRADDAMVVIETAHEGILLRHHMWADHWFTITTTTDMAGHFVETGGPKTIPFTFNCDISTPFELIDGNVYTVDLWLDVLVRADGTTFQVVDRDHFARAQEAGWLSEAEVSGALHGLEELVGIVERGDLIDMLSAIWPFGPAERPANTRLPPVDPLDYPRFAAGKRLTW